MSNTIPTINIDFNRKPSRAVIMRTLGEYLKQGAKNFDLRWGENWIDLSYDPARECWFGYGWIKDISGDDVAKELTQIRKQAVREVKTLMQAAQAMGKLQIIHVG